MEINRDIKGTRNSIMSLGEIYFWTDTIHDWKPLLQSDKYKNVIIESLRHLVEQGKITIYGFVIMPNHRHLLWELVAMNGKEMPQASFNKFTSHQFLNLLRNERLLSFFKVEDKTERAHRFWQRNPLVVLMNSKEKLEQKLDYIHYNPLQEHWNLATTPENYYWSTARYYEEGIDDFKFLTHYRDKI